MANLAVAGPFAARAGGARPVDDEGVANVSLCVGHVEEEALAKGENDLIGVNVAETVAVIKVIGSRTLPLALGENKGSAVDVGDVGGGVQVFEVMEEVGNLDGEGAFIVR